MSGRFSGREDALAISFFIVDSALSGIGGSLARSAWRFFGILGFSIFERKNRAWHAA
jgi:hypothetical protein